MRSCAERESGRGPTKVILIVISILIGAVLGERFNVLILVPAAAVALVSTAGLGIANGDPMWSVALTMVSVTAVLQVGYWLGSIPRLAVLRLLPLGR
jgi:hypothetical protein